MNTATITSAIKLSSDQRKKLLEVLKKKYRVTELEEQVDPEILGGLKVTIGSMQLDLSVKNKLEALKK